MLLHIYFAKLATIPYISKMRNLFFAILYEKIADYINTSSVPPAVMSA